MANDFIQPNTSIANPELARELKNFAVIMLQAVELSNRLKKNMTHMIDGADYSALEGYYGLATGQGSVVAGVINTIQGELAASANIQGLIARMR